MKKITSLFLTILMICSLFAVSTITSYALVDVRGYYVPSETVQEEIGTNRYYFYMPDAWCNEYACTAGVYWWLGTDYCAKVGDQEEEGTPAWPGYRMYRTEHKNVFYIDLPKDVCTLVFNNYVDGGEDPFLTVYDRAMQTIDVGVSGYEPGDNEHFPDGVDSFDQMIYVPNLEEVTVNPLNGRLTYGGEWMYYHNNGICDFDPAGEKPTEPPKIAEEPKENVIYFEPPAEWGDPSKIYAHIWMPYNNSFLEWNDWKSPQEEMTKNEDGTWSYDLSRLPVSLNAVYENSYCVVFVSDTDKQTYSLVFGVDSIGDTAYATGRKLPGVVEVSQEVSEVEWRNNREAGPQKTINKQGELTGRTNPCGCSNAGLLAEFFVRYYELAETQDPNLIFPLMEELQVTAKETAEEIANVYNKKEAYGANYAYEKFMCINTFLGMNGLPEIVCGDVNCDGVCNVLDVTQLQVNLATEKRLTKKEEMLSDANFDGKVDIQDATQIQLMIAGQI